MNNKALKTALFLLSTLCLTGCLSAASTGASVVYKRYNYQNTVRNHYLALQAQQSLDKDPELKENTHIVVTCVGNMAVLTGQAPNFVLKQKALSLVKATNGIEKVIDQISIESPVSKMTKLHDTWITTKISSKIIASAVCDPDDITIITENGNVYLIGSLLREQANAVIDIAQDTDGVNKVVTALFYLTPSIN